ncbi:MAG: hypothetical protein GXP53_00505 [Deltaproteobacteria bacterium]|nr:hypothetical protein [Deltaproteobacteria bacterium]
MAGAGIFIHHNEKCARAQVLVFIPGLSAPLPDKKPFDMDRKPIENEILFLG